MSTDANGATVNPHAAVDTDKCPHLPSGGVAKSGKHKWEWMWEAGTMSDKVQCANCAEIRKCTSDSNEIIKPGVIHNVDPV
jgi:hypothetical protein